MQELQLESPSIEFGEDSDSILVENLLASVSQHQMQKNSEQTLNRMKARLMNGYWVFQAPWGYTFERSSGQGKILMRDEPIASIIQEALEGYASGRFQTQAEVKRFLENFPEFPKDRQSGEVRNQTVTNLLKRVVYAGYVESKNWGVTLRPGQHTGLISYETYQKIQTRLNQGAYAPARKNLNEDFPLRGFVSCGHCGTPLTACWSKGSHARYPYYLCPKKGCESYRKSIRKEVLEADFEALLRRLEPPEKLFKIARMMFEDLWNHRLDYMKNRSRSLESNITKIDRQIEQLLDRIIDTESSTVISRYEKRIQKLEEEKIVLNENIAKCGRPVRGFDETVRTAMDFLASPCNLWNSDRLEDKHAVLKLCFTDRLSYVRNEGVRTVKTTLPFKVLGEMTSPPSKMARPARFERATAWFVVSKAERNKLF